MVGMAQFCPKNNLCISLLKHWCMVSFATQGTFESKQFQPMFFCIELSHILWIWWAKGQFHFLTKIRYSGHFDNRNFSHLSRNFHTMVGMAQFCPKNNLYISLLKHWCMVSFATQGTFESKQFQPVFCLHWIESYLMNSMGKGAISFFDKNPLFRPLWHQEFFTPFAKLSHHVRVKTFPENLFSKHSFFLFWFWQRPKNFFL